MKIYFSKTEMIIGLFIWAIIGALTIMYINQIKAPSRYDGLIYIEPYNGPEIEYGMSVSKPVVSLKYQTGGWKHAAKTR